MLDFLKNKSPYDKTVSFIEKKFPKQIATILLDNMRPCFELDNTVSKELTIGGSKQAGFPDLPPDFNWPELNGQKLDFIVQLNLSELDGTKIGLPKTGILYFFLDLTNKHDFPEKEGEYRVIFSETTEGLTKIAYDKKNELEEKVFTPIELVTIPGPDSYLLMHHDLSDNSFDNLLDLELLEISKFYGSEGVYDIGKLVSYRILDEWVDKYKNEGQEKLNAEKSDHSFVQLLSLTLDEWGYVDTVVHFGIHKKDVEQLNFDKTLIVFESS